MNNRPHTKKSAEASASPQQPRVMFSTSEIGRRVGVCTRTAEARLIAAELFPDALVVMGTNQKVMPVFFEDRLENLIEKIIKV